MPRNVNDVIWDGRTGSQSELLRAEGRPAPPDEDDLHALTGEIVATQKGVQKVSDRLTKGLSDLERRIASLPDVSHLREFTSGVLGAVADAQRELSAASAAQREGMGTAIADAVSRLGEKVSAFLAVAAQSEGLTLQLVDMQKTLASVAVEVARVSARLAEEKSFLAECGFKSVAEMRFVAEQWRRWRASIGKQLKIPDELVVLQDPDQPSPDWTRSEWEKELLLRKEEDTAGEPRGTRPWN